MARVKVRLFGVLRAVAENSELEIESQTLGSLVQQLCETRAALHDLLLNKRGTLREGITLYLNNKLQTPPNLSQRLADGDLIVFIPAVGGG